MANRYQQYLDWLRLPGDVAALIQVLAFAIGGMAVMSLWAFAVVSRMPVGPRIGFLVFFGVFVFAVSVAIFVAIYRFWNRRKKKAEDRLIGIAQGEVRDTLRALLEELATKLPGMGEEFLNDLEKAFDNATNLVTDGFIAYLSIIWGHTHNEKGEAQFRTTKEYREFLKLMREVDKESISNHVDGHASADTNSE